MNASLRTLWSARIPRHSRRERQAVAQIAEAEHVVNGGDDVETWLAEGYVCKGKCDALRRQQVELDMRIKAQQIAVDVATIAGGPREQSCVRKARLFSEGFKRRVRENRDYSHRALQVLHGFSGSV